MIVISKDEIIEKLKDFELINKAVKGAIEENENHGNLVYFIAINEVINLINECDSFNVDNEVNNEVNNGIHNNDS